MPTPKSEASHGPLPRVLSHVLPLVVALLAACTPYQVSDRSMYFNASLQDFDNRQVLLNAVRASKRYPPYYTAVNQISSTGELDGSQVNFSLPFGPVSHNVNSVSPMIKVGTGITVQTNPLDTQDFYQGYMTPVKTDLIGDYLAYGWPRQVVVHAFMREVDLPMDIVEAIKIALYQLLQAQAHTPVPPCMSNGEFVRCLDNLSDPALIAEFTHTCSSLQRLNDLPLDETPRGDTGIKQFTVAASKGNGIVRFVNDPGRRCDFATFQFLSAILDKLQLAAVSVQSAKTAAKPITVPTSQTGMSIKIQNDATSSDTPKTTFVLNKLNDPCPLANGAPSPEISPDDDVVAAHPAPLPAKGDPLPPDAAAAVAGAPPRPPVASPATPDTGKHAHAGGGAQDPAAPPPDAAAAPAASAPAKPKAAAAKKQVEPWETLCKDQTLVAVVPRSPEALVFYLGQLIDAEYPTDGKPPYIPMVRGTKVGEHEPKPYALFDVKKSSGGDGAAAEVSVSLDDETYYIPRSDTYNSTMHMLTLAEQVIGLEKKGTQIPGIVPVQVINP